MTYARLNQWIEMKLRLNLSWMRLLKKKSEVDGVAKPHLPIKRTPVRPEVADRGKHYFPSVPKEHYRHMCYSAIDVTIECIRTRFNQKESKVFQSIQELLLKAIAGKDHEQELMKDGY